MNILPKKSWHVRNKDNVAKVRKDEENARLEEKEQSRRAALAEQEARTNFLRQKARSRMLESGENVKDSLEGNKDEKKLVPANFFTDSNLERGENSSLKNPENEKEKKEEQINYEKKIGLLTYLGQSAVEGMEESAKPWYFRAPERADNKRKLSNEEDSVEKDTKRKSSLDPIHMMKEHVRVKRNIESEKQKSKHKKHKHKKHHKKQQKERDLPRGSDSDKLAKLREERLSREKKERERTMALLNGKTETDDNSKYNAPGRYHSQFNPHLVRQRNKY